MESVSSCSGESGSDGGDDLVKRASSGDEKALAELFERYRKRLRRMVQIRLDRRLQGRVDPSDVLQEAYIDLARRLPEYASNPSIPLFLWLRLITGQRLLQVHRRHIGTAMRDVTQEVSLYHGAMPQATSLSLAASLIGKMTSISEKAMRTEMQIKLQETLNSMEPIDREILVLRHFEELTNQEAAQALGIRKSAASNRYIRALKRLREVLSGLPGFFAEGRTGP